MQDIRCTEGKIDRKDVTIIYKDGNPIMEQGPKKVYLTLNNLFSITKENADKRCYNLNYEGYA